MKKQLLFAMLLGALGLSAQTTHHIDWGIGAGTAQFSATIDVGDTVMWMWTTSHPHTVTTQAGSAESFDSGTMQGVGLTYQHTFTVEGTNPYVCLFHSSMAGVITVQALAAVENHAVSGFEFYPNPVSDILTINAPKVIDRIQIFDMAGKLIIDSPGGNPTSKIYMNGYHTGTYLVKVTAGGAVKSFSVLKK